MLPGAVFCRPGRKYNGVLEVGDEELTFSPPKETTHARKVQIKLSDIQSGFLLEPTNSLWILHFHLHHEITIGATNTLEVQFCQRTNKAASTTVSDSFLTKVEDKIRKAKKENEFAIQRNFKVSNIRGIKGNSRTELFTNENSIISITEKPFFVLAFKDIDSVILERVTKFSAFCDITFLPQNLTIQPMMISSVSKNNAQSFVERLQYVNYLRLRPFNNKQNRNVYSIPWVTAGVNFNWKTIVQQLLEEKLPRKSFAALYKSDEEELEENEEEEEEEEEDFEPSEDFDVSESFSEETNETQEKLEDLRISE